MSEDGTVPALVEGGRQIIGVTAGSHVSDGRGSLGFMVLDIL